MGKCKLGEEKGSYEIASMKMNRWYDCELMVPFSWLTNCECRLTPSPELVIYTASRDCSGPVPTEKMSTLFSSLHVMCTKTVFPNVKKAKQNNKKKERKRQSCISQTKTIDFILVSVPETAFLISWYSLQNLHFKIMNGAVKVMWAEFYSWGICPIVKGWKERLKWNKKHLNPGFMHNTTVTTCNCSMI